jgi:serine/threonine-protein phosphatase 2A regulatory subunit A
MASILTKDENKQHTLPLIIASAQDKSWRVRHKLAQIYSQLAEAFGKDTTDQTLIQIFS